jgi:thioredoxin-like negative regulator of GroEL
MSAIGLTLSNPTSSHESRNVHRTTMPYSKTRYCIHHQNISLHNNIHPPNMSKVTPVTSSAHFRTITSSATFTVVDFYADWCGPCKVISPVFEQLATAESKPGKIVFCKVDVDAQREIAGNYGVSA